MLIPSPPPDATSTVRGLINRFAQTFAGVKTFTSALIASAGIQLGLLFNTNGAGASDVVVKAGTSAADASVNAAAKLFSVRTGLNGGTEVEQLSVTKGGTSFFGGGSLIGSITPGGGFYSVLGTYFAFYTATGGYACATSLRLTSESADGASSVAIISNSVSTWVNVSAKIHSFRTGNGEQSFISSRGTFGIPGSIVDGSGTPGPVTQSTPKGRAAIANGATSVTITNDQVTVDSFVCVEWEQDPAQRHTVTCAAGSFTVTLSAAAAANRTFRYFVVR